MKNKLLTIILLFLASISVAQHNNAVVKGKVFHHLATDLKVLDGQVSVKSKSGEQFSVPVKRGAFKFELPSPDLYQLTYSDSGRISTNVIIDARIPEGCNRLLGGKQIPIVMYTLGEADNVDFSSYNQPLEKYYFDCELGEVVVNEVYHDGILKGLRPTHEKYLAVHGLGDGLHTTDTGSSQGSLIFGMLDSGKVADKLIFYGRMKDVCSNELLDGYVLIITNEGDSLASNHNSGTFVLFCDYEVVNNIYFISNGYVTQQVVVHVEDKAKEIDSHINRFHFDVPMVPDNLGLDYSVFEKCIGYAVYDRVKKQVGFNYEYTRERIEEFNAKNRAELRKKCPNQLRMY